MERALYNWGGAAICHFAREAGDMLETPTVKCLKNGKSGLSHIWQKAAELQAAALLRTRPDP